MSFGLRWRILVTLAVTVLALIYVLPSIPGVKASVWGKFLPANEINLGLDLKGGMHLTLEVEVDKALETTLVQFGQELKEEARDEQIVLLRPRVREDKTLEMLLVNKADEEKLKALMEKKRFSEQVEITSHEETEDGKQLLIFSMKPVFRENLAKMTLEQAVKTIRNRIDEFGVAEPDIRKQQDNRIQVQLPGLNDTQRAKNIIGQTAHLEFKLVDEAADVGVALKGIVPPGSELAFLYKKMADGSETKEPMVLKKEALFTGQYIADAGTRFDEYGKPEVSLTFSPRGARVFERVTGDNVKKRMAIVLDGKIHSAPVIQDRIAGGQARITGHFTTEEAHDLAIVLRAGSLPAPVKVLEERTIGPSLGQESIEKGIRSALIGGAVVAFFVLIYYAFAGVVANVALMLNILLIMACMAAFGATLTLPGIAGIILTIGMAVDANVLIYERIREELKNGLAPKQAIQEGFSRATLTIFDSNLTTVITGIILYQFGTGPIRGFAVTLIIGLVASMFTAIFVARVFFDLWTKWHKSGASLSI